MSLRIDELQEETAGHEIKVGPARLAGIPGTGTLQLVRDENGAVKEAKGTWHADDGADLAGLERAAEAEEALRYEGRLYDPAHADRDHVEVDVVITSYGTYEFDARLPEGEDGPVRTIFNFRPVGEVPSA